MRVRPAALLLLALVLALPAAAQVAAPERPPGLVRARIAALVQPLTYNRFGSHNPHGMIYALRDELVDTATGEALRDGAGQPEPGRVRLRDDRRPRPLVLRANVGDTLEIDFLNLLPKAAEGASICRPGARRPPTDEADWPATCDAGVSVVGLEPAPGVDPARAQGRPVRPGERSVARFDLRVPGVHLMLSHGAPAGGEGDGGSLTHGLFGVVVVGAEGSRYYRSQVTAETLAAARAAARGGAWLDYEAADRNGKPLLAMHRCASGACGPYDPAAGRVWDVVNGDLNAIAWERGAPDGSPRAHRAFAVVFHDELKTRYDPRFAVLDGPEPPAGERPRGAMLDGARDGFAINYGASGIGTILLANRMGIGPARDCAECAYEEFFLQSWANGDPALLPRYRDDPSNVAHSYLGDPTVFHNLHAGPKETHIFHLHAHQWRGGRNGFGAYLDSQTIAPLQAFTYEIDHGGSGNRNLTAGDSIYHCHLYPHFAQGMWALWRVHDVLEDGTRRLPDGELGLGTDPRTGATTPETGTPIPAVVPLPGRAMPLEPDYAAGRVGYPFFLAGEAGRRAPQAPNDIADDGGLGRHVVRRGTRTLSHLASDRRSAADPGAVARAIEAADFSSALEAADIALLPPGGTPLELAAMAFHGEAAGPVALVPTEDGARLVPRPIEAAEAPELRGRGILVVGGHASRLPDQPPPASGGAAGPPPLFLVNGRPARPGAPIADPCLLAPEGEPEPGPDYLRRMREWLAARGPEAGMRLYEVSAIDLDLQVNAAGWHDPQGRINVLTAEAARFEDPPGEGRRQRPRRAAPFFFRAQSGECVVFVHQNRTRAELELDDFQVRTPTDTIGQHIHLVKFDVLASDGAGNGWNYEDGTFARDAVIERLEAAGKGRLLDADGVAVPPEEVHRLVEDLKRERRFQSTVQRWWADPTTRARDFQQATWLRWCDALPPEARAERCRDATLRTVFTHDHFGPSSIQQHGFYNALLIEPAGSRWFTPDGQRLCDGPLNDTALGGGDCLPPTTRLEGIAFAPTAQAYIQVAATEPGGDTDANGHRNHREFPVAIADFALLYDPNGDRRALDCDAAQAEDDRSRDRCLPRLAETAQQHLREWREAHGTPVDRPDRPESSSTDHHNPYLLNYGHEPLPLRLGEARNPDGTWRAHWEIDRPARSRAGDPSLAFSSAVHGDPFTEILRAFEGERAQIRLVHGAQEVQHTFTLQGLSWVADPDADDRGSDSLPRPGRLVSAQEIGLSEHFEFDLAVPVGFATADQPATDYLYALGSLDGLWNGAWGLLRAAQAPRGPVAALGAARGGAAGGEPAGQAALCAPGSAQAPCPGDAARAAPAAAASIEDRRREALQRLRERPRDRRRGLSPEGGGATAVAPVCPEDAPRRRFAVRAVDDANRPYNARAGIRDPFGVRLAPVSMRTWSAAGEPNGPAVALVDEPGRPLVLRALAGECLEIEVENRLRHGGDLPRLPIGEAPMPRIAGLNLAEQDPDIAAPALRRPAEQVLRPSATVGLAPQGAWGNPHAAAAGLFGGNDGNAVLHPPGGQLPTFMEFYLGRWRFDGADPVAEPFEFGPLGLLAFGDALHHATHGLTGALVVLPADAEPESWTGVQTRVRQGGRSWREFVLIFRDGLNLHAPYGRDQFRPIPDCPVCDDTYDWGERAVNFGTEPLWARLGLRVPPRSAAELAREHWPPLNQLALPPDLLLNGPDPATPTLRATAGEDVRVHVLQPSGRARQRAFTVLGHGYPAPHDRTDDDWPGYRAPNAALVAPGRAFTARLGPARSGLWLYRDGPTMMLSSGVWGHLDVGSVSAGRTPPPAKPLGTGAEATPRPATSTKP